MTRAEKARTKGVLAYCDHPQCYAEIHRGDAHQCSGCGLFFCRHHLVGHGQRCQNCVKGRRPFKGGKPPIVGANDPADAILQTVAEATGVTVNQMRAIDKSDRVSRARFMAMKALRNSPPGFTLMQVAKTLHRQHHTTIRKGLETFQALHEQDAGFRATWQKIERSEGK